MKLEVAIVLLLSATLLSAHEHSTLKLFASGVISGVSGPEATVPEACFDQSTCVSLEDALIHSFTSLVRGHDSFSASNIQLLSALKSAIATCGFDTCEAAIEKLWTSTEQLRLAINAAMTFSQGIEVLGKAAEAAANYHWEELGYNLGKSWRLLNDGSSEKAAFDPSILTIVEGIVLGLSRREVASHPCYDEITKMYTYAVPLLEGAYYAFVQDDSEKLNTVVETMKSSSGELYKACKVEKFMENVVGKVKSGSYASFGTNIMMNMSDLRKTYEEMKGTCGANWKDCGVSVGKIVRFLLGWSL